MEVLKHLNNFKRHYREHAKLAKQKEEERWEKHLSEFKPPENKNIIWHEI